MDRKQAYVSDELKSNLTIYQQNIALTDSFRNWFHNSIVKDYLGEPLILWHGSHVSFESFDNNSKGIFFCDFNFACNYAKDKFEQVCAGKKTDVNGIFLYECFLNIQNPYICNREKYWDIKVEEIWERGYDGIIAYKTRDSDGTYDQYVVKNPEQIKLVNKYG